jgi:hypothetical protein
MQPANINWAPMIISMGDMSRGLTVVEKTWQMNFSKVALGPHVCVTGVHKACDSTVINNHESHIVIIPYRPWQRLGINEDTLKRHLRGH